MEHPGAIFYNASGLLLDESATQKQLLGRASLISHETAHMWFGDLVTMKWFNDVWMKEVFANVMAAKIVNPSFPTVNHDLRFLFSYYPAAYDVDRTDGANPIRQPLANLNEAGSLYGAIIYQKAPIVMRQLELLLGEESFRDGLREYLKAHAFGNATWNDLITILDARTDADLVAWSRAWVEERGRPRIAVAARDDRRRDDGHARGHGSARPRPRLAAATPARDWLRGPDGSDARRPFRPEDGDDRARAGRRAALDPADGRRPGLRRLRARRGRPRRAGLRAAAICRTRFCAARRWSRCGSRCSKAGRRPRG